MGDFVLATRSAGPLTFFAFFPPSPATLLDSFLHLVSRAFFWRAPPKPNPPQDTQTQTLTHNSSSIFVPFFPSNPVIQSSHHPVMLGYWWSRAVARAKPTSSDHPSIGPCRTGG